MSQPKRKPNKPIHWLEWEYSGSVDRSYCQLKGLWFSRTWKATKQERRVTCQECFDENERRKVARVLEILME